jgi:hypothetical protein
VGDNDDYAENKIRPAIVITADIALVLVVLNIIASVGSQLFFTQAEHIN